MSNNGWRSGSDPTVRALRAVFVISAIGLLIYWLVVEHSPDVWVAALLVGAVLAALFSDIGITLPFLTAQRRKDRDQTEREDDWSRTHMDEDE